MRGGCVSVCVCVQVWVCVCVARKVYMCEGRVCCVCVCVCVVCVCELCVLCVCVSASCVCACVYAPLLTVVFSRRYVGQDDQTQVFSDVQQSRQRTQQPVQRRPGRRRHLRTFPHQGFLRCACCVAQR